MTVTLEKLGGDTRNSFIEKLKESFDAFVEENPGTPEGPVISCGEIEASLNRPGTEAYWALRDGPARRRHRPYHRCGKGARRYRALVRRQRPEGQERGGGYRRSGGGPLSLR